MIYLHRRSLTSSLSFGHTTPNESPGWGLHSQPWCKWQDITQCITMESLLCDLSVQRQLSLAIVYIYIYIYTPLDTGLCTSLIIRMHAKIMFTFLDTNIPIYQEVKVNPQHSLNTYTGLQVNFQHRLYLHRDQGQSSA